MSEFTLTKTRLFEGVWEGVMTRAGEGNTQPQVEVTHLEKPLPGVEVTEKPEEDLWVVRVPVPAEMIADGVQTFLINDAKSGETLNSFALLAGEALSHDIRAEMNLLREELDMLKRAFRRHCLETM
ncbi:hypothetical protein FDP25_06070 [Roseovarius sp. A21]|uniref:Uncharacterized protein n=1 Tax=Roseovarius bejariae TaxID=2576383 RepID=A0A844CJZ5_9RHOB|nr:hypothetical protein [Roseovarius bejariae]MRU14992.1 hypothetical protein [Roseovarius bejariae]